MIPLSYVTRENGDLFGSVELDLINRAPHDDPLFNEDNSKVYFFLEEETRGTQYAARSSHINVLKMVKVHYFPYRISMPVVINGKPS
jgi:hypothetical protein